MGRYWHCVLTADHLIRIYSTVAIIRSQVTTRTTPRLSHDHLVRQPTAVLCSFRLCHCLYRGQTAGVGGSRDYYNSLDFSLDNRDIAARFPGRASNFTVFQNAQTGSGADPLSYLQGKVKKGLEWSRGFQEVKIPRFHDNGTGWW